MRLFAILAAGFARLPWRLLIALGALLGTTFGLIARRRRRVIAENLALAFPALTARQRRRLLRRNLRATGIALMEHLAAWFRPRLPRALARFEGLELIAADRRPLLLVSAHFLPLELIARLIAEATGRRFHLLARPYRDPCLERLLAERRLRFLASVIAKHETRRLVRALRAGPGMFYAPDQRAGTRAPRLPFFGIEALTHDATARLAAASGARVLLFSFRRQPDLRYHIRFEAPDWPLDDPIDFARRYLAWLEARIREAPEQYLWAHRRFRDEGGGPYRRAALRRKHR